MKKGKGKGATGKGKGEKGQDGREKGEEKGKTTQKKLKISIIRNFTFTRKGSRIFFGKDVTKIYS